MARAQIIIRDILDGAVGVAGLNSGTAILYQINNSGTSAPTPQPSGNFTYTFSSGSISLAALGAYNGWTTVRPTVAPGEFLWRTQATASSRQADDNLSGVEFSVPVLETGTGEDGFNQAVVILYKANSTSVTAPLDPTGPFTYTFSNGSLTTAGNLDGWNQNFPTLAVGQFAWAIQATVVNRGTAGAFTASDFSAAVVAGNRSIDGTNGINTAVVDLYLVRTVLQGIPSGTLLPAGNFTYTFGTDLLVVDGVGATFAGWTRYAPDVYPGTRLYKISAVASSAQASDTFTQAEFSSPVAISGTGIDGSSGVSNATSTLFHKNTSPTVPPATFTGNASYTFSTGLITGLTLNGWSQSAPLLAQGEYLWQRTGFFSSTSAGGVAFRQDYQFSGAVNTAHSAIDATAPAKGVDYNDSARSVSRTVYYHKTGVNNDTVAPGAVSVAYNFNSETFSNISLVQVSDAWTLSPPTVSTDGTTTYWAGTLNILEDVTNGDRTGSGSGTISNVQHGWTFQGLVRFESSTAGTEGVFTVDGNVSTIDGGTISANSITANKLQVSADDADIYSTLPTATTAGSVVVGCSGMYFNGIHNRMEVWDNGVLRVALGGLNYIPANN